MKPLLSSLLLLTLQALADTATQTDWSDGPGTPGPVGSWASAFSADYGTDWFSVAGSAGIAPGIEHEIAGSIKGAFGIAAGDADGDGDMDIIDLTAAEVVWWENADGTGTAWIEHVIETGYDGAYGLCADDLDGDGDMDVIASSALAVIWWENADGLGSAWYPHTVDTSFGGVASICTDDIDEDGSRDVLAAGIAANAISWWDNADGQGNAWVEHVVDAGFAGARSVFTDDMDADGDRDVLGAAMGGDIISWWENADDLGNVWIEHVVDSAVTTPWSACSDDLDGDGDRDVFGAAFNGWTIACWENVDGLGNDWVEYTVDGALFGPCCVYPGDPDSDGDGDILGAAYYGSILSWWENTGGPGTNWTEHVLDQSFDGAFDIGSADMNGDGDIDIVGAACYDAIAWWDLHAYPGEASLVSSILYTGCDPDWGALLWDAQTPAGTSVSFQVRASDDPGSMNTWSDTLASPCSLHGILADNASYVQYRAILATSDPDVTPALLEVTLEWNSLGTGGGGAAGGLDLLPISPNPSPGPVEVSFGIPVELKVDMEVFDISGRCVERAGQISFAAGWHTVLLDGLRPGVYFLRVRAGEFEAVRRFGVVE